MAQGVFFLCATIVINEKSIRSICGAVGGDGDWLVAVCIVVWLANCARRNLADLYDCGANFYAY